MQRTERNVTDLAAEPNRYSSPVCWRLPFAWEHNWYKQTLK